MQEKKEKKKEKVLVYVLPDFASVAIVFAPVDKNRLIFVDLAIGRFVVAFHLYHLKGSFKNSICFIKLACP